MITVKEWFDNRYTSLADKTARERMEIRRISSHKKFHEKFCNAVESRYRNQTDDQKHIIDGRMLELLP